MERVIQKDLGEIFQRETQLAPGKMVTVTVVRISPDLSLAKVYLSIFPGKEQEENLKRIKSRSGEVRKLLGDRVRNQLRIVPELSFYLDDSLNYAERIDELLK